MPGNWITRAEASLKISSWENIAHIISDRAAIKKRHLYSKKIKNKRLIWKLRTRQHGFVRGTCSILKLEQNVGEDTIDQTQVLQTWHCFAQDGKGRFCGEIIEQIWDIKEFGSLKKKKEAFEKKNCKKYE